MKIDLYPSAAHSWTKCQAGPRFIAENRPRIPKSKTRYSQEGDCAHHLAEENFVCGWDEVSTYEGAYDYYRNREKKSPLQSRKLSREMVKHLKGFYDYVLSLGGAIKSEIKVSLYYNKERNGYIDALVLHRDEQGSLWKLTVVDLKFGAGYSVEAKENEQAIIYSESVTQWVAETEDISDLEEVCLVIYQPRVFGEEAVRYWTISGEELSSHSSKIGDIAKKILKSESSEDLPFVPDEDNCRFCDAQPICKAYTNWMFEGSEMEAEELSKELPLTNIMSVDDLSAITRRRSLIVKWFGKVYDNLKSLTEKGEDTGFKFVQGRKGNQFFEDLEKAEGFLLEHLSESEVYKIELISPTQAKEAMIEKGLAAHIVSKLNGLTGQNPGNPTLVPLEDPRPPYKLDFSEEFE